MHTQYELFYEPENKENRKTERMEKRGGGATVNISDNERVGGDKIRRRQKKSGPSL
jgi:hypothetical protein